MPRSRSGVIAFVSGTARGFSGFGSALIFMPLASSMAAPRLVAALLLMIDFVAAAPLVPNAWKPADRKATAVMVLGRAGRRADRNLSVLSRLDPVTTRWIISGFVCALLLLLCRAGVIAARTTPAISSRRRRAFRLLQRAGADRRAADRRLLARPADRVGDRARQHPVVFRRVGFLLAPVSYAVRGADQPRCDPVFAAGRPGLRASASRSARRCSAAPARNCSARSVTR